MQLAARMTSSCLCCAAVNNCGKSQSLSQSPNPIVETFQRVVKHSNPPSCSVQAAGAEFGPAAATDPAEWEQGACRQRTAGHRQPDEKDQTRLRH